MHASVETNDATARRRSRARLRRQAAAQQPRALQQRRAEDHRQRGVARQHACVLAREAARARGGERRAVARDAGHQRARLRETEREPVGGARVLAAAIAAPAASAAAIASAPASKPAAMLAGVPRRRSIARSKASPTIAGGRKLKAMRLHAAAVEAAGGVADLVAQADEQRGGGAGVQRDLEGLAQLAVERDVGPVQQPRHERDVAGGGDRQQLGGSVQQPERDRVAGAQPRGAARLSVRRHRRRARPPRRPRRRHRRGGSGSRGR